MPLAPQPDSPEKRVKEFFRTIWGLSTVFCLAVMCAILYGINSVWGGFLAMLVLVVHMPLCLWFTRWVCQRKGLSLERETKTPFVFEKANTTDSSAELSYHLKPPYSKMLVSVVYVVAAIGLYASKSFDPRWLLPLGLAILSLLSSVLSWRSSQKPRVVASADSQKLCGRVSSSRKPVCASWEQITSANRVEKFDMFGKSTGVWLVFEDANGHELISVRLNSFQRTVEEQFLSVVARYLPTPTAV